ncbi:MAG: 4Fe-4S binding protein [Eubacterium sp.]|nr:4Fe-4S binding protein [Eubacterium sp.]
MVYKDFQGLRLSALGLGAMRLPASGDNQSEINVAETEKMVAYAMEHGINYYDTAWGYHNGHSETVIGKILRSYPRDSYYLATKFPGYDLSNMDKIEEIFEKQLEKCGVDYFDFYLFHNVCEMNIDAYLDPKYGILDYLIRQKENGRIRHLGFSAHASCEVMRRFLDAYGAHMEFGQLQLNWIDWTFQNAKEKAALLTKYQIPVWVMEPLRGGKLASVSEDAAQKLRALRPDEDLPAWAFRFLQGIEGVTMILSGMSTMEQLQNNIRTFETERKLNQTEWDTLLGIAEEMIQKILPCTACRYCTAHCPKGLDIPKLLELYNEHCFTGGGFIAPMALMAMPQEKHPSACIGCRSCEAVCPQQIKISEAMADFHEKLKAAAI